MAGLVHHLPQELRDVDVVAAERVHVEPVVPQFVQVDLTGDLVVHYATCGGPAELSRHRAGGEGRPRAKSSQKTEGRQLGTYCCGGWSCRCVVEYVDTFGQEEALA